MLIALEQTAIAPAMGAWREAKEEQWLAMTGNAASETDLAKALLVLAQEGLGQTAWVDDNDDEEEKEEEEEDGIGSWAQWVEKVKALCHV